MAKSLAIHPKEILLTEFMEPYGLAIYRLAKELCAAGSANERRCAWHAWHFRGHGVAEVKKEMFAFGRQMRLAKKIMQDDWEILKVLSR